MGRGETNKRPTYDACPQLVYEIDDNNPTKKKDSNEKASREESEKGSKER